MKLVLFDQKFLRFLYFDRSQKVKLNTAKGGPEASEFCGFLKGQLISKGNLWYPQFFQKRTIKRKNSIWQYYDTSGRIVSVRFLEELKTPKRHFEINWPLENLNFNLILTFFASLRLRSLILSNALVSCRSSMPKSPSAVEWSLQWIPKLLSRR